jgi:hypothetical protein
MDKLAAFCGMRSHPRMKVMCNMEGIDELTLIFSLYEKEEGKIETRAWKSTSPGCPSPKSTAY